MQQNIVDLARVGGRAGLVAGAAADLRGPVVRAGRVADDGQFDALGLRVAILLMRKRGTASIPVSLTALICATGASSSRASLSTSILPPRDSIRSDMFSSTSVGSPTASTGWASMSWRVR